MTRSSKCRKALRAFVVMLLTGYLNPALIVGSASMVRERNDPKRVREALSVDGFDVAALEKAALDELRETGTPGAAIAVTHGNAVVYAKGLGISNVETGAPVTTETLFHIGSLTKSLTAAAVLTLADQGKLEIDAPIGAYIKGLSPKIAKLTAHQLLSQTSGLKDIPGDYGLHDETALGDFVRSRDDNYALIDPGKAFSYSNLGYAIAGLLIEQLTGKPYADAMNEIIFQPVGMNRTTFRPTQAMTFPLAMGHVPNQQAKIEIVRPLADDSRLWPAGYIFTSLSDISRYYIALLNGGKLGASQVIPSNVGKVLTTPHIDIPTNQFVKGQYGYGLFIQDYDGERMIEHAGALPGYSCEVRMLPDRQFAVIVLCNRDSVRFEKTFQKAFELIGLKAPEAEKTKSALPMTQKEMERYVGNYSNRWEMRVLTRDGKLFLKRFDEELQMVKIGENRFAVQSPASAAADELVFVPGDDGKPDYMLMFIWFFKRQ